MTSILHTATMGWTPGFQSAVIRDAVSAAVSRGRKLRVVPARLRGWGPREYMPGFILTNPEGFSLLAAHSVSEVMDRLREALS